MRWETAIYHRVGTSERYVLDAAALALADELPAALAFAPPRGLGAPFTVTGVTADGAPYALRLAYRDCCDVGRVYGGTRPPDGAPEPPGRGTPALALLPVDRATLHLTVRTSPVRITGKTYAGPLARLCAQHAATCSP